MKNLICLLCITLLLSACKNENAGIPSNEIWYTTTDGNPIELEGYLHDDIKNAIVSNTYKNGKGILQFNQELLGLGNNLFSYSETLLSIELPPKMKNIAHNAFRSCDHLSSVKLPDNITYIDDYAFGGCEELTTINLPKEMDYLGEGCFSGCKSLKTITLPDNLIVIKKALFEDCSSLSTIVIPSGVLSIEDNAFAYCDLLNTIELPNALTFIGEGAFLTESLSSSNLKIPKSVNHIGEMAYKGCSSHPAFKGHIKY